MEATVSNILQTCIFGDDRQFLRRLAYVETLDGTDASAFNSGNNGGIWRVSLEIIYLDYVVKFSQPQAPF